MSASGGTMIRGNMLISAKGTPTDETAFTERNNGVDAPRKFKEAINNVGMLGEMVHNGIIREDVMNAVPGNRPLNFQNKFSYIFPNKQATESTYIATDSILEFNLTFPRGLFTVLSDFELLFPVKFVDRNGNKIHIGNWIPVNNFFGHQ